MIKEKKLVFSSILTLCVLCMVAFATPPAMAFNFNIDGNWSDWGITVADNNNSLLIPTAGINFWREDSDDTRNDYQVGPGWGGQNFDAEAIYAARDDTYLYFAIVSGGRPDNGTGNPPSMYEPGDIVIRTSSNTYVVETTGFRYVLNGSGYVTGTVQTGVQGGLYRVDGNYSLGQTGNVLLMNGLPNWQGLWDNQDPTQIYSIVGNPIVNLQTAGWFSFTFPGAGSGATQHSFMEGKIALSDLSGVPDDVHWAFACGNDGSIVDFPAGGTPIPEPATMVLLGTGLVGLAGFGKRKLAGGQTMIEKREVRT